MLLFAACGDNSSPCDYTEVDDVANATTAELTGLTVGTAPSHVCGAFDQLHFTSTTQSADDDRYRISVTVATPLLFDVFVGDGLELLTGVTVRFFDTSTQPVLIAEAKPAMTDHGAFIVTLAPGDYDMVIVADAIGEIQGASIPYRIRMSPMPACDATTGAANYAEKNDVSGANDTVSVDFTKDPSFTAMTSTSPELTALSIDPGNSAAITGAIDTRARSDQYLDRDTYELTTGKDTNELAVRLEWDGATSDLDYLVFEASTMLPVVASNVSSNTGPELQMFAVKPDTKYWLWVGGFQGSTAATYRATVCANRWFY